MPWVLATCRAQGAGGSAAGIWLPRRFGLAELHMWEVGSLHRHRRGRGVLALASVRPSWFIDHAVCVPAGDCPRVRTSAWTARLVVRTAAQAPEPHASLSGHRTCGGRHWGGSGCCGEGERGGCTGQSLRSRLTAGGFGSLAVASHGTSGKVFELRLRNRMGSSTMFHVLRSQQRDVLLLSPPQS